MISVVEAGLLTAITMGGFLQKCLAPSTHYLYWPAAILVQNTSRNPIGIGNCIITDVTTGGCALTGLLQYHLRWATLSITLTLFPTTLAVKEGLVPESGVSIKIPLDIPDVLF